MKTYLTAFIVNIGFAASAYAAPAATHHYAVIDTVGNCAVVDTHPSRVDGLRILGNKGGYANLQEAQKALGSQCKSVIERI